MSDPTLSPEAQRTLRIILDGKILRGGELIRLAGFHSADELAGPVKELVSRDLVEVTGDLTPDGLPFATFGTRPSAQSYLRALLRAR